MKEARTERQSQRGMFHVRPIILSIAAVALLAGCVNAPAVVQGREDLIADSGFQIRPGTSPAYIAALKQLPPHRFAHHTVAGVTTYYYLDPTICGCLYTGTEQNWNTYKQALAAKRHMQAEDALMRDDIPFEGAGG
jgi:hypothetical protein